MLSDDNGCLCAHLPREARPCMSCEARRKAKTHCKRCGKGLFEQEDEEFAGLCSNCHYEWAHD